MRGRDWVTILWVFVAVTLPWWWLAARVMYTLLRST